MSSVPSYDDLKPVLLTRFRVPAKGWKCTHRGDLSNGDFSMEFERGKVKVIVSISASALVHNDGLVHTDAFIHASVSRDGRADLLRGIDMRDAESLLGWPEVHFAWASSAGFRAAHRIEPVSVNINASKPS